MRRRIFYFLLLFLLCGCRESAQEIDTETEAALPEITVCEPFLTLPETESKITESETAEPVAVTETKPHTETEIVDLLPLPDSVSTNITNNDVRKLLARMAEIADEYGVSVSYISGDGSYFCSIDGDKLYRSASTVKAIYCQYLVSTGIDLSAELLFDAQEARTSVSGMLASDARGERFSVGELIEYTLVYSDNMAYRMLFEEFGVEGFNRWVKDLGLEELAFPSAEYEFFDVSAGALSGGMMVILQDGRLIETMKRAGFKLLALGTDHETANKYGYEGGTKGYHDTGIILAPNPYVLTVMSIIDANRADAAVPFYEVTRLCDKLNEMLFGAS
ncbi:MAG: serine hydrolase [Clostridia bacterium]|nr:serine hydrolase [Clostridia bacterium]